MKLPTYHLTWCDKIKAMFSQKHAAFYVNVEEIVSMRNRNASFRVIASGLGLSQLDVKNIYYRSLGLKYKTEFSVQIPSEMSMLDSRVAKKLIKVGLNSKDKIIKFAGSSDDGWIESISRIDGIGFKSAMDVCKWFLIDCNVKHFKEKYHDDEVRFLKEVNEVNENRKIKDDNKAKQDIEKQTEAKQTEIKQTEIRKNDKTIIVPFDGNPENPKYIEAVNKQKEIAKEIIKKELTI